MRGLAKTTIAVLVFCGPALDAHAAETSRDSLWRRMFSAPQPPQALSVDFVLLTDIELPGPPSGRARILDGRVEIPVAGGTAVTDWAPGSEALLRAAPDDPANPAGPAASGAEPAWSTDPEGIYRARFRDDGKLIMQRRCRFLCRGWNTVWRLRIPGSENAPPLLTRSRVYFGAPDNRVYSLRKRTGERLWAADIGERASRPVMVWEGSAAPPADGDPGGAAESHRLVVVLPDAGSRLLALDARTGAIAARHELSDEQGTFRGTPLTTPDGKLLVARDKYRPDEASLMVFELTALKPPPARRSTDAEAPVGAEGALPQPEPNPGASRKKDQASRP